MPYTYSEAVRELTPLFENIPNAILNRFVRTAAAKIDRRLGGKYQIPITKKSGYFNTGTVSISKNSNVLSGSSTEFLTESGSANALVEGDYILINSRAVVRIEEVLSETTATLSHNADVSISGGTFFIVPDSLVLANEYLAAKLIIIKEFSQQAYNQETEKFSSNYGAIAEEEITGFLTGNYYDSTLEPQASDKTAARIVSMVSNDTRTNAENLIAEMNNNLYRC